MQNLYLYGYFIYVVYLDFVIASWVTIEDGYASIGAYVSVRKSIVSFAANLGARTNNKHLSQSSHNFYIYTFYTVYNLYALSASYGYYPITSEAYVSPKL